jgi:hypothetical protein
MTIEEGKNKKQVEPSSIPTTSVVIKVCDLFKETFKEHGKNNPVLVRKLIDFINHKKDNPLLPFGKVDKGIIDSYIPSVKHAHLNLDVSVWYSITGKDPRELKLYALLTHEQSGTGEPPKRNIQQNVSKKMSNQQFVDFNPKNL